MIITIDLGAVKPISGASFHTAAGVAGVELPQAIVVLVSDDGTRWREAGDLVAASRSQQAHAGYAEHLLRADNLATRGRYVAFLVEASGAFVFADEIENYTVAPTLCSRERSSGRSWSDLSSYHETMRTRRGVHRRLTADCAEVKKELKESSLPEAQTRGFLPNSAASRRPSPRCGLTIRPRFAPSSR